MQVSNKIIFIAILFLALLLRGVNLTNFTPGLYLDEASLAYDAYSLGKYGTDQYGKSLPVYLRSFATYQAPLYAYVSIIPVKIFGMSPLGIRLVSVISGMITIIFIYLLCKLIIKDHGEELGLASAFVLAVSPWHILFSRNALEANLGLCISIIGIYLIFRGFFKNSKAFILCGILALGITNYTYHAYRFTSIIVLILLLLIYWRKISKGIKKTYIIGIILFLVLLIPQFSILTSPGSLRRIQSTQYSSENYFQNNGGELRLIPLLGRYIFMLSDFSKKYFDFLSPNSLFLDSDPAEPKSVIELGAFYSWMLVFCFMGAYQLMRSSFNREYLIIILIGLVSIIPSAITTDNLYFLRTLNYLILVSIITGLGLITVLSRLRVSLKYLAWFLLLIASMANLYINYFQITSHERAGAYTGFVNEMFVFSKEHKSEPFVVELKEPYIYINALYIYKYDPLKFQKDLNFNVNNYYNDITMPTSYIIDNLSIRPIDWEVDVYKDQFLAGDELSIPDYKINQNGLEIVKIFRTDLAKSFVGIYKTNPLKKCQILLNQYKDINKLNSQCKEILVLKVVEL